MTQGGLTKLVIFMTSRAGVLVLGRCHITNALFLEQFLLYYPAQIRQTMYIVILTNEGYTKIVNFMTTDAGVLMLGREHISHIVKMPYLCKNLFSSPRHLSDKFISI